MEAASTMTLHIVISSLYTCENHLQISFFPVLSVLVYFVLMCHVIRTVTNITSCLTHHDITVPENGLLA